MPRSLLVLGAGGHGKVVADVGRSCGYEITGYADSDASLQGRILEPGGAAIIATQESVLATVRVGGVLPRGAAAIAVAIGRNDVRLVLAELLSAVDLPILAHRSAIISASSSLGRGTVVCPLAVINAGASIGAVAIVNTAAVIEHDCIVEAGAHISPGAVLAGGVHVGQRSWVGAGATVIDGIRIGSDVIVGAGAVVIRDVPDGQTVAGCPAKPIQRPTSAD